MRAAIKKVIAFDFGRQASRQLPQAELDQEHGEQLEGIALLITKDSLSLQWAPRWLQHTGLEVKIAATAEEALTVASATRPSVMIADAGLVTDDMTPLLVALAQRLIRGTSSP